MNDLDMTIGQMIFCLCFGGLAFIVGLLSGYGAGEKDGYHRGRARGARDQRNYDNEL